MHTEKFRNKDIAHLWHPYTDVRRFESEPYVCVERAQGAYLYDVEGRAFLDGISSWWAIALGHGHPRLLQAMQSQAARLQHSILGTLSHPAAVELAARLAEITPPGLTRVYFASDGSSVVEAAMKIAVQYQQFQGKPNKHRFISFEGGYHGDTIGAMSVGFLEWFRAPYGCLVTPARLAPSPYADDPTGVDQETAEQRTLEVLSRILEQYHHETAAVFIEPLCQCAGGMRIHSAKFLTQLKGLCERYEVLLVADEIATGFGRTGRRFACEHAGITPDILCVGKALTGGYLPLSAAVVTDAVYEAYRGAQQLPGVLWDGHTFCGHPIACATALAALEYLGNTDWLESRHGDMVFLQQRFGDLSKVGLNAVRSCGWIVAGDVAEKTQEAAAQRARRVAAHALENGLFVRPLGHVLYLMPPLTCTQEELNAMVTILEDALAVVG